MERRRDEEKGDAHVSAPKICVHLQLTSVQMSLVAINNAHVCEPAGLYRPPDTPVNHRHDEEEPMRKCIQHFSTRKMRNLFFLSGFFIFDNVRDELLGGKTGFKSLAGVGLMFIPT